MYVLHAREHSLNDVNALIETHGIDDVEIHRPFLGKTVIHCASERSAELLRSRVQDLRAA